MKRIIILLFSILSISLNAQELKNYEILNLKYFEVEYKQEGAIDKETGSLRISNSEYFVSEQQEAREIAMDISVRNVTVPSGRTLELASTGGSVKIYDGFKVEAGATFIIKINLV